MSLIHKFINFMSVTLLDTVIAKIKKQKQYTIASKGDKNTLSIILHLFNDINFNHWNRIVYIDTR